MSGYKSIGQVAYHKALTDLNLEELAARQRTLRDQGPGVRFVQQSADTAEKSAARQQVLELFAPWAWPTKLHLITMPSASWTFERKLLGLRETAWTRKEWPHATHFTCCENDRSIYHAALTQMPGLHNVNAALQKVRPYRFAELGYKTRWASLFFCDIDDFMAFPWTEQACWDGIWLDYTGPLTPRRLRIIGAFYQQHISGIAVVSATMGDRHNSGLMRSARSLREVLSAHLPGEVLHFSQYNNEGAAMAQFAVRRREPIRFPGALRFWAE